MMINRTVHILRPRKKLSSLIAGILLILFAASVSSAAGDSGGKEAFRKGKADIDACRYADAVTSLTAALQEFDILADYALYYLAEAYHHTGEHTNALATLRSLLRQYPSSILKKKARWDEIREVREVSEKELPELLHAYVTDFPDDDEAAYQYGQLLTKNNEKARATAIFKRLYIGAGPLAQAAHAELAPDEISLRDTLERAENLARQYDFADVEREVRQALSRCGGKERQELLRKLANALFRQKKYREAAEVYAELNDTFFRARSLYRAGDKKGFESALQMLTEKKDRQAGYLLVTVAADKRRDKDFEGALQTYQEVLGNYPSDAEEALWGAGWTRYLSGDYAKAAETFAQLHKTYGEIKYLYWQAKSTAASGENAEGLFSKVMSAENNFYAALAATQNSAPMPLPAPAAFTPAPSGEKTRPQERIDALISVGMREEAVSELMLQCRQLSSVSDLLSVASLLQDLGEYKRAISLVTKAPYSAQLHRFWYPLAFWDKVEENAQRNRIDPYIVLSVMREESRFDRSAKSPAGAYGLMQLMPQTAYRLDRNLNLGISRPSQLTDPGNNIALGTYYLKKLSEEFSSLPLALAAYNAGEAAVRSWQHRFVYRSVDEFIEDIPYVETRNYVKKVLTSYFQYRRTSTLQAGSGTGIDAIFGRL
jgi:soluble lytic murein transglycosylase